MSKHEHDFDLQGDGISHMRDYVARVITMQHATLCSLLQSLDNAPHDVADMFEDASSRYAELADMIRDISPKLKRYSA